MIHLPSQTKIVDLRMQAGCKDAAAQFAALDVSWWTCITDVGPDSQEMRNIYDRVKPRSWQPYPPNPLKDEP